MPWSRVEICDTDFWNKTLIAGQMEMDKKAETYNRCCLQIEIYICICVNIYSCQHIDDVQ